MICQEKLRTNSRSDKERGRFSHTGRGPHMIKSIFDIKDTWRNTLMNAQNQIRLAEYQTCGQFLTPDMLTVGMGGCENPFLSH